MKAHELIPKRLSPVELAGATTPLLRVIANNPRLVDIYRQLTQVLVKDSELPPHERWVVTMRMAWRCNCRYEFGRKAKDAATAEDMGIVVAPADDPNLSEPDRLLLEFVDQLHDRQNVEQRIWTALAATHTPANLVELVSLAGLYLLASSVANTCGAETEARS